MTRSGIAGSAFLVSGLLLGPLSAHSHQSLAAQAPTFKEESLVTRDPDAARRAVDSVLAVAAHSRPDSADRLVASAERIGAAYAAAWGDSVPGRSARWFRASPESVRVAKVLADSLRQVGNQTFTREGLASALQDWRRSLATARRVSDTVGIIATLANIGTGFYRNRQPDSARAYLLSARQLGLAFADYRAAGTAVGGLASIHKDAGEYGPASELYQQAARLHQRAGDTRGLAADYNNMGLLAAAVDDTARARRAYEQALALNRRYGRATAAAANLVNLGVLLDLQGRYAAAFQAYGDALTIYQREGDRLNAALVWQNLGRLALRTGSYPEAVKDLRGALAIYAETGPAVSAVGATVDLARALAETGALQEALDELDRGAAAARKARLDERQLGSLLLAQAEMLARLNRVDEADRQLSRAQGIYAGAGSFAGQADAEEERGLLELRAGRTGRAVEQLRLALDARRLAGDVRAAAATRLLLGYALEKEDDTASAHQQLEQARRAFDRVGDPVGQAVALGALAQLAADEGTPLAAESLYVAGLKRLGRRPAPTAAWWLHLGLGQSLRDRHADIPAAAQMRASIDALEQSAGSFALPELRTAFMDDKLRPYAELASVQRALGQDTAAFAVSERMRARELLDLMARARVLPGDDTSATGEEQALRERIGDLSARLTGQQSTLAVYRGPPLSQRDEAEVREGLVVAEARYAVVLERLRREAGSRGSTALSWVASASDVRARLGSDEVFIEYLLSDTAGTAFLVTRDTLAAVNLDVGRKTLANLVEFARATMAEGGSGSSLWEAPLRRLYDYLIQPLDRTGLLAGKRRLFIVPHAELHYLPFATLLGPRAHFLIERFDISYAPSASVWLRLAGRGGDEGQGMLALAPEPRSLPGADDEVREVARVYGASATALFGAQASERTFKAIAPRYRWLHIATYGLLDKQNPLFSYVAFQPAGEDDGRLEVHEIFNLHLHARLVALSACQTALGSGALGDVPAGDDWVGLIQAFLSAGADKVLATAWPIADRPTAALMDEFYRRLRSGTPEDAALAAEQRVALADPATRPPRIWGAFMLTGGR